MTVVYETPRRIFTDSRFEKAQEDFQAAQQPARKAEKLVERGAKIADLIDVLGYEVTRSYLLDNDEVITDLLNINRPGLRTKDAA